MAQRKKSLFVEAPLSFCQAFSFFFCTYSTLQMSTGMNSNTCKFSPCPPELNQACRRLLSPSKRKSDDENEFGCCSISPVKSPRSSPDDVSPVKSFNHSRNASSPSLNLADQTTPKSCSRLNSKRGSRGL